MNQNFDVIIIGAGPAGLMAAITCSEANLKVIVLEKNNSAGKKLLITGGGKCNLTNTGTKDELLNHYGDKPRFVKPAIYNFSNTDLINYFEEKGVKTTVLNDNKIFPHSQNSRDILNTLLDNCTNNGVKFSFNAAVKNIAKADDIFEVFTETSKITGSNLIIATGGKSYPKTGSEGDGYSFAKQLGNHKIIPLAPALTPVFVNNYKFVKSSGISIENAHFALYRNNKKIQEGEGDMLYTHKGLSGPGILDFSRYIQPGDVLKVGIVKTANKEKFDTELIAELNNNGKKLIKNSFSKHLIPERLLLRLFELLGISPELKAALVDKKTRIDLVNALTEFPFEISRLGDYNEAMVTAGGVSTKDINGNTMESRLIPQLYFVGEVIDICGDTGGYNLQFAFSTGYLAGKSITKTDLS